MGSSKVRKEEAELRQIAKRARVARKEDKKRATAQKRRELQRNRLEDASAEGSGDAPNTIRLKTRRNAVVMAQKDVEQLHRKLHLPESADSKAEKKLDASNAQSGRATQKAGTRGAKKSVVATSLSSPSSQQSIPEPNYHFEIHYKHKEVLVDVVLHHIPHQKINLDETTPTQLVVDTTQHTKKYRLVLPMPPGLRVNSEEGSYELENGVLRCRLPILNGEIPAQLQSEWDALQEKVRAQRALRFRVDKDGDLAVRVRRTLLAKNTSEQARLQATRSSNQPGKEAHNNNDVTSGEAAIAEATEAATATATTTSSMNRKRGAVETKATNLSSKGGPGRAKSPPKKIAKGEPTGGRAALASGHDNPTKAAPLDGKKANPTKASIDNANKSLATKKNVFAEEHAKAVSISKAVAAGVRHSIREKVQLAKEVQQKRLERLNVRSERHDQRRLREEESFRRVLAEQKRQLLAQAALKASTEEAARKKELERKGKQGQAKSVSFKE